MRFLAYFDYLGFKDFIDRNDPETQQRIILNNFRDIETALADGKVKPSDYGIISDLSNITLGCTVFSDTVLFWTRDNSFESLQDLLITANRFNWQCIDYCFPVRGSIVYGEFQDIGYSYKGVGGGTYNINSLFGKALIHAYFKAENQDWAGTIIDESVERYLFDVGMDPEKVLLPFAKKYMVPYKNPEENQVEEWVFNLVKGGDLNDEAFRNMSSNITANFSQYNKSTEDPRVKRKIENTLKFLESYR